MTDEELLRLCERPVNHWTDWLECPRCAAGPVKDCNLCGGGPGLSRGRHLLNTVREQVPQLLAEKAALLGAIQTHHDQKAEDRCWLDDITLYAAADMSPADIRVGDKEAMLANCKRFIERRCEGGGWPTYAKLEAEKAALVLELEGQRKAYALLQSTLGILSPERDQFKLRVRELEAENGALRREIGRLKELLDDFARRIAAKSEQLARNAEKKSEGGR